MKSTSVRTLPQKARLLSLGGLTCIGYAGYQLITKMGKPKSKEKLLCDVDAIGSDLELYVLLAKLQKFHNLNESAFYKAVENIDRLLYLRLQLQNGSIEPTLRDRPLAFNYYQNAIGHLESFVHSSRDHIEAHIPVLVYSLYEKIYRNIEGHWTGVLQSTNKLPMSRN